MNSNPQIVTKAKGAHGIYHAGDEQPVTLQQFLDEACGDLFQQNRKLFLRPLLLSLGIPQSVHLLRDNRQLQEQCVL